jgi:hypothetical protein
MLRHHDGAGPPATTRKGHQIPTAVHRHAVLKLRPATTTQQRRRRNGDSVPPRRCAAAPCDARGAPKHRRHYWAHGVETATTRDNGDSAPPRRHATNCHDAQGPPRPQHPHAASKLRRRATTTSEQRCTTTTQHQRVCHDVQPPPDPLAIVGKRTTLRGGTASAVRSKRAHSVSNLYYIYCKHVIYIIYFIFYNIGRYMGVLVQ